MKKWECPNIFFNENVNKTFLREFSDWFLSWATAPSSGVVSCEMILPKLHKYQIRNANEMCTVLCWFQTTNSEAFLKVYFLSNALFLNFTTLSKSGPGSLTWKFATVGSIDLIIRGHLETIADSPKWVNMYQLFISVH